MPVEVPYSSVEETLFREAEKEERNRLERFKKAWQAYRGEWKDSIRQDSGYNDNVKINPARFIVNTGVHYLFGKSFSIQGDYDNSTPPDWAKAVETLLRVNKQDILFPSLGINGAVTGHVFVKIRPTGAGPGKKYPSWTVLDPANVRVQWDAHDINSVTEYKIEYAAIDNVTYTQPRAIVKRQLIQYQERDNNWLCTDQVRLADDTAWSTVGEPQVWPYWFAPIVDCQNLMMPNDFWGLPDLEVDVLEIVHQLQYILSNCAKIVRLYGSPRVQVMGITTEEAAEIDVSPDNIITYPDPDAKGEVLRFDTDLPAAVTTFKLVQAGLREMTQVPEVATGEAEHATRASGGPQMAMLFAPLIAKTDMKRSTYGEFILELLRRTLAVLQDTIGVDLGGVDTPWDLSDMRIEWPESLPGAAFLERNVLAMDEQLGASNDTVLMKLGYDPTTEQNNTLAWFEKVQKAFPQAPVGAALAPPPKPPLPKPKPALGQVNPGGSMGGTQSAGTPKS